MKVSIGKKRTILVFLSFSILCLGWVFALAIPMIKKVYQKKDSLEESKLILKRDQGNIEEYKKDLEYLKQNSFLSEDLIVNESNRIILIEELEKIAKEKNLIMKIENYKSLVNNRTTKEEEVAQKITLKLSLTGDYNDFLVFLYKLQNFKYAIGIDKLTIEKFDDSKIKNFKDEILIESLPEIESEVIVSFNE